MSSAFRTISNCVYDPDGIRTRVFGMKIQLPRPLEDRANVMLRYQKLHLLTSFARAAQ